MALELWVEKYRPKTLDEYVFQTEEQKSQIQEWANTKNIPQLLFSGGPGTGKTTLAKVLINELGVDSYDVKHINASRDNGVDYIRNTIEGFVQTMPFGDFKIVLLDEADYLSINAQAVLRGLMETYHQTARFILTCNYPNKIIPALHSRCQGIHIDKTDQNEFTARAATVLVTEGVEFDLDTLDSYVKATYPDLRKCLNSLQQNSASGTLTAASQAVNSGGDYKLAVIDLFKAGKIKEARTMLCAQVRPEEMEDFFRFAYDNLDLWGNTEEIQDAAIIIIRQALCNIPLIADQEINLSACLVELANLRK